MTAISVSIEQVETQWVAFVDGLLGCFHAAGDPRAAADGAPQAARAYLNWRRAKGGKPLEVDANGPVEVREMIREWVFSPEVGAVSAFFATDAEPLSRAEVEEARCLFNWTYGDLARSVKGLSAEVMAQPGEGEWTLEGILQHTGREECWYLSRLGLAPAGYKNVDNWHALLYAAQQQMLTSLSLLAEVRQIEFVDGALWSPRKVARRALWRRVDQLGHIAQFKQRLGV